MWGLEQGSDFRLQGCGPGSAMLSKDKLQSFSGPQFSLSVGGQDGYPLRTVVVGVCQAMRTVPGTQ